MQEKSSVLKIISKVLSVIFHPVFIPTAVFAFLIFFMPSLFFGMPEKTKVWWLIIIAYITITFPLLVVFLLWRLKFIESIQMNGEKERYAPLIASMLFYFWVFWLFHKQFAAPELVQSFLFGVFLTTVGVFLSTLFFKISMHTAALGGVVAFAVVSAFAGIPQSMIFLFLTILTAGLIGSARLYLDAHNKQQIYAGYIVGIAAQFISFLFIHKIFF